MVCDAHDTNATIFFCFANLITLNPAKVVAGTCVTSDYRLEFRSAFVRARVSRNFCTLQTPTYATFCAPIGTDQAGTASARAAAEHRLRTVHGRARDRRAASWTPGG